MRVTRGFKEDSAFSGQAWHPEGLNVSGGMRAVSISGIRPKVDDGISPSRRDSF